MKLCINYSKIFLCILKYLYMCCIYMSGMHFSLRPCLHLYCSTSGNPQKVFVLNPVWGYVVPSSGLFSLFDLYSFLSYTFSLSLSLFPVSPIPWEWTLQGLLAAPYSRPRGGPGRRGQQKFSDHGEDHYNWQDLLGNQKKTFLTSPHQPSISLKGPSHQDRLHWHFAFLPLSQNTSIYQAFADKQTCVGAENMILILKRNTFSIFSK